MTTKCSVEGCLGSHVAKGFCNKHYYRLSVYGSFSGGIDYQEKAKKRFLSSFIEDSSGCHLWVKTKDRNGYGKMSILRKSVQAHRYSWELHNGRKIPDGMVVMHKCNNKSCVNPDHLEIGTLSENAVHAILTNRRKISVLNEDQVKLIRSSSLPSLELAKLFDVTFSCIDDIKKMKTWKYL